MAKRGHKKGHKVGKKHGGHTKVVPAHMLAKSTGGHKRSRRKRA